jgi:hypothetical protein
MDEVTYLPTPYAWGYLAGVMGVNVADYVPESVSAAWGVADLERVVEGYRQGEQAK